MKSLNRIIAALTLLSAPSLAQAGEDTPVDARYPETYIPELAHILDTVPERAPELISQSLQQQESGEKLEQAKSTYYPRLDLSGAFGYRRYTYSNSQPDDTALGLTFNATLRRPIYYWGAIEASIKQAHLDYENDTILRALTLRRIRRDIRADYLTLVINQASLRNTELRDQLNQLRQKNLQTVSDGGRISQLDLDRNEIAIQQTLMDLERIRAEQDRITRNYRRRLGWDQPLVLDAQIPQPDTRSLLGWLEAIRAGTDEEWMSDNGQVLQRENGIEREKQDRVSIASRQKPLINFAASVGQSQSNTSTEDNVDTITYFAGIDVSWNIFDGFDTRHRKIASRIRQRRLEKELDAFRSELGEQAANAVTNLIFQCRQLDLDQKRYDIQKQAFEVDQSEFQRGRISDVAFRERELGLRDQEVQLLKTRANLIMGLGDYLDLVTPAQQ